MGGCTDAGGHGACCTDLTTDETTVPCTEGDSFCPLRVLDALYL